MSASELFRAIDAIGTLAFPRESTRQYVLNILKKRIRNSKEKKFTPLLLPVSKLKKEMDRVFSIFIRSRGSDVNGCNVCVTCGAYRRIIELQAGHYQPRQDINTRWDEKNVWPQCGACNGFRGGEPEIMAKHIDKIHGSGTAELLQAKARIPMKLDRHKLTLMIQCYKQKI